MGGTFRELAICFFIFLTKLFFPSIYDQYGSELIAPDQITKVRNACINPITIFAQISQ